MKPSSLVLWDKEHMCLATMTLTWSSTLTVISYNIIIHISRLSIAIILLLHFIDIKEEVIASSPHGFTPWLRELKAFIGSCYHQEASKLRMTTYSVQFEFKLAGCDAIHVDLLVSPYFSLDAPQDFYRLLKKLPRKKRKMYLYNYSNNNTYNLFIGLP